jgi:hypothetical protein
MGGLWVYRRQTESYFRLNSIQAEGGDCTGRQICNLPGRTQVAA